ncbi:AraC family transcriptional regulator [Pseudonocardia alni]|uniref:AraC family transcriptional regulator n=1 Tax=Pseudonocardia alni TaxID=33907 RepID=UPI00280A9314|nr:AraC family transcriptional regulator [Pseudonocardia alni]
MGLRHDVETGVIVDTAVQGIGEARELGRAVFYPQDLTSPDGLADVGMSVRAARLGPLVFGELAYRSTVRIDCGELLTSYHVNVPLNGRIVTSHRGEQVVATPQCAAVYGPQGPTVLSRWEAGAHQLCVKIDRRALEAMVARQLDREIVRPIRLAPVLDLRTPAGQGWRDLAKLVSIGLHTPHGLPYQSLAAGPLIESLLGGLLSAVGSEFSDDLAEDVPSCPSSVVRDAVEYLRAHATEPITVTDVAVHCSISVRALQESFARHVGCSPLQYLRRLRLRLAHEELLASDPATVTVARVAHRWGFGNAGRFAVAHEREFGESPAAALRRTR